MSGDGRRLDLAPEKSVAAGAHATPGPARTSPARARELRLKRWLDVGLGTTAIVALAPLLALLALIVRLDSPGPVFFRQTRIGMGRRTFEMWKFRTMVRDATDQPHRDHVLSLIRSAGERGAMRKVANDARITRVGRWLRRSSLDELPQLFNVVRGEMSLVGPRPPVTYEYETYEPWQLERFDMPQGMTGLWQVSGRNRVDYQRMHELDITYVRTWSLWLDLRILAATLRAIAVDGEPTA